MKEPFDKKLAKKIRDSFEVHEEPFDPKEWEKFSAAYFRKSKKPIVAWWYWAGGLAASFLLIAVLWNPFSSSDTAEKVTAPIASNSTERTPPSAPSSLSDNQENSPAAGDDTETALFQPSTETLKDFGQVRNASLDINKKSRTNPKASGREENLQLLALESIPDTNSAPNSVQPLISTVETTSSAQSHEQAAEALAENAQQKIDTWLAEAGNDDQEGNEDEKTKNPVKLGVLMAPQNISNSTQNLNFGAGIMSEIPFSKRLKLDVGLGYAQQSLTPDQSGFRNSDTFAAETLKASSFSGNYINYTAELSFGQIEIPLNLKYAVIQKKSSDFYLVSGISNMFYVNQQQTTTFNSVAFASNAMTAGPQVLNSTSISESPANTGGQVDVGQLINLGMGFEQNLKNGTSISFEPFYKFTVGQQTFVDQRFAIGGINLRMNFQLKK